MVRNGDLLEGTDGRFLSSVDNGWLAVGLIAAAAFGGEFARHAETVRAAMDFGSRRYLVLDQGMTMAALGNALGADVLRAMVSGGSLRVLRPLMAVEDFGAAARAASIA